MKRSVLVFLLLAPLSMAASKAYAKGPLDAIKDSVWQDCDRALEQSASIPQENRAEFVAFLKEIISLDLAKASEVPLVNPQLVKAPDSVLGDVSLAQSLDPEKPVRAKRCAADLLPRLLPESETALMLLVKYGADVRSNSDVRASYSRSAFTLAQRLSADASSPVSAGTMVELLSALGGPSSELAEEILSLFPNWTLDSLFPALQQENSPAKHAALLRILESMDFQKAEIRAKVLDLLEHATPETSVAVLPILDGTPALYEELARFIMAKVNVAEGALRTQYFTSLQIIFDSELRSASLAIAPSDRFAFAQGMEKASPFERDVMEKCLLVLAPFYEGFSKAVAGLLDSSDADVRYRVTSLLAKSKREDADVKRVLVARTKDQSLFVRIAAIQALSKRLESSALDKLAKEQDEYVVQEHKAGRLGAEAVVEFRSELLANISDLPSSMLAKWLDTSIAVLAMAVRQGKDIEVFVPTAFDIVSRGGEASKKKIKEMTRSDDASVRSVAVVLLRRQLSTGPENLTLLLQLLSDVDPEVAGRAEIALLALIPDQRDDLVRLVQKRSEVTPRFEEVAVELGLKPERANDIIERSKQFLCPEIAGLSAPCLRNQAVGAFCLSVVEQIPKCVEAGILNAIPLKTIANAVKTIRQLRETVEQFVLNSAATTGSRQSLLMLLIDAGALSPEMQKHVCEFLPTASAQDFDKLAMSIGPEQTVRTDCLKRMRAAFEAPGTAAPQKALLFRQLLALDPNGVDAQYVLRKAVENNDFEFLQLASQGALLTEILPLLQESLVDGDDAEKLLALRLVESLAEKSAGQLSFVTPLLEAASPELRYFAARAVIASNVDVSLSTNALRVLLNSQKFRELLVSPQIPHVEPILQDLLDTKPGLMSSVERRNAQRLLRALKGPGAEIAESLPTPFAEEVAVPEKATPLDTPPT